MTDIALALMLDEAKHVFDCGRRRPNKVREAGVAAADEAPDQAKTNDGTDDVTRPDVYRQEVVFNEIRGQKCAHQGPVPDSNKRIPDIQGAFRKSHVNSQLTFNTRQS